MIFGILKKTSSLLSDSTQSIEMEDFVFKVLPSQAWQRGNMTIQANHFFYTSEQMYSKTESGYKILTDTHNLLSLITKVENNIIGLEFTKSDDGWVLSGNSARMNRARLYYTVVDDGLLFSPDARCLIPFTSRKMNVAGAFSTLKYGNVPEDITVVQDLFNIPVANCFTMTDKLFGECLSKRKIPTSACSYYFNLQFPMDGGSISDTQNLLENEFDFISGLNPLVPISGGVDSTLLNHLIDRSATGSYPGYYIQFGDDDPELEFAKKAAANTKADLQICKFNIEDTEPSFNYAVEHAILPIGESSTISTAHFYSQTSLKEFNVVDGTMADGCYGTANYNIPLKERYTERPKLQRILNEHIAATLKSRNLPGHNRFHPQDSFVDDPYLQFMDMYLGPFGNTWLKNAKQHSEALFPLWQQYYSYLDESLGNQDEWMKYSIFKMVNYAGKTQTAKSYDNAQPSNTALFPFTWLSVLLDQGHYSWEEKTRNDTVKFTLKKILEKYQPSDFVYRKKVGLNSCFEDWIASPKLNKFFIKKITRKNGVAEHFLGHRLIRLVKMLRQGKIHPHLARMVINMSILDAWLERHNVSIK